MALGWKFAVLVALVLACTTEALPTYESLQEAKLEANAQAQAQARAFVEAEESAANAHASHVTQLGDGENHPIEKEPSKAQKNVKPAKAEKTVKPAAKSSKDANTPAKAEKDTKSAAKAEKVANAAAKAEKIPKPENAEKGVTLNAEQDANTPSKAEKDTKSAAKAEKVANAAADSSRTDKSGEVFQSSKDANTPAKAEKVPKSENAEKSATLNVEQDANTPSKAEKDTKSAAKAEKVANAAADSSRTDKSGEVKKLIKKQSTVNTALRSKALQVNDELVSINKIQQKLRDTDRATIAEIKAAVRPKNFAAGQIDEISASLHGLGREEGNVKELAKVAAADSTKLLEATRLTGVLAAANAALDGPQVAELGESGSTGVTPAVLRFLTSKDSLESMSMKTRDDSLELIRKMNVEKLWQKQLRADAKVALADQKVAARNEKIDHSILEMGRMLRQSDEDNDLGEGLTSSSCDSIKNAGLRKKCLKEHTMFNLKDAKIDEKSESALEKQSEHLVVAAEKKISDIKLVEANRHKNKRSSGGQNQAAAKSSSSKIKHTESPPTDPTDAPTIQKQAAQHETVKENSSPSEVVPNSVAGLRKLVVAEQKALKQDDMKIAKLDQHQKQTDKRLETERAKINQIVSVVNKDDGETKHKKQMDSEPKAERNQIVAQQNEKKADGKLQNQQPQTEAAQRESKKAHNKKEHKSKPSEAFSAKQSKANLSKTKPSQQSKSAHTTASKATGSTTNPMQAAGKVAIRKLQPVLMNDSNAYRRTKAVIKNVPVK